MRTLPEDYSIEASSPSIIGFMLNGSHSYVRSTDSHCESRSQNIFSSVDIPVDSYGLTARAVPATDIKRQLIHYKTAMVTSFTTREKAVNLDQCSPVPFTLILKLTKYLTPSSIADTTSQLAVSNHIPNCQDLNSNYAIGSDQISSQLVQKVSTSIADSEAVSRVLATLCAYALHFGVYLGYFKSCFISVIRAFGFPSQFLLRDFKLLIQSIKMLWIGYPYTVASTQQARDANINPNFFISWWQWLNSGVIYQQRNKPFTRWLKFDCNCRRTNAFRQKPRPYNVQWLFAFSKPKSIVSILKSRLGKLSRTTIALGFKSAILSSFTPEISKRFLGARSLAEETSAGSHPLLQMSQTLLQRHTANFIEKVQVFSLFPTGQQARGLFVINSLLSFVPSFGFSCQGFIIDKPDTTHCPSQEIFLLGSGKKSVSISSYMRTSPLYHSSHFTMFNVKK